MICQRCKINQATIEYFEDINGKQFGGHYCAACYNELFAHLHSKSNNDLWAELLSESAAPKKVCPVCGTTYEDFERTFLLGCASCYDVFKKELLPSIRRIHGKVTHVGAVGKNNDELGLYRRLNELKDRLEKALREKRYGEASRLNRQINDITKALFGERGDSDE